MAAGAVAPAGVRPRWSILGGFGARFRGRPSCRDFSVLDQRRAQITSNYVIRQCLTSDCVTMRRQRDDSRPHSAKRVSLWGFGLSCLFLAIEYLTAGRFPAWVLLVLSNPTIARCLRGPPSRRNRRLEVGRRDLLRDAGCLFDSLVVWHRGRR